MSEQPSARCSVHYLITGQIIATILPRTAHNVVRSEGLAACLRAGTGAVQVVAANAVCHVACASPEARRALGDAGIIVPLVKMLDAKSPTLQESSAQVKFIALLQLPSHLWLYHIEL